MKRIIITKTNNEYHYEVALAIAKAAGMSPKAVVLAGLELLYKKLKEKQDDGQSERRTTDEV